MATFHYFNWHPFALSPVNAQPNSHPKLWFMQNNLHSLQSFNEFIIFRFHITCTNNKEENWMLLSNIEQIPGKTILEHYGVVSGSTVRAKNVGRDFAASLKNIVGGELKGYTQLLSESRDQAIERMKEQAAELGANAIVNVRFSTSSITQGASELFAYGTAVKVGE